MKTESEETTGRDDTTCTLKPYRLTCVNHPDRVAGPRTGKRAAEAEVQKEEHPGGAGPGPEPTGCLGELKPATPAGKGEHAATGSDGGLP